MTEKRKQADRRKSTDFFGLVFIWMNIAACAGLIAAILIFYRAQPEFETFFDRFYHLKLTIFYSLLFVLSKTWL